MTKTKPAESILPIFGVIFYILSVVTAGYGVYLLLDGEFTSLNGYVQITGFLYYILAAIFLASWGALLVSIGVISQKIDFIALQNTHKNE